MIELQLYLPNNASEILKTFKQVGDPASIYYGLYQSISVISQVNLLKVKGFVASIPGATYEQTLFPDVILLKVSKSLFGKVKFPKWVQAIESDPTFTEILRKWDLIPKSTSVEKLPHLPPMSDSLKKRLNLECMCEGIKGRTLLAPIDSQWAEFPSVTVVSHVTRTLFSHTFERDREAPYQSEFVSLYLKDAQIKRELVMIPFQKEGRAAPDCILPQIDELVHLIREVNHKRQEKQLQTVGFLNFVLYQNAFLFSRKSVDGKEFPTTFSIWSGNRGLGRPNLSILRETLLALPKKETTSLGKAVRFLKNLLTFV